MLTGWRNAFLTPSSCFDQGEAVTEMAVYKVLYQLVRDKRMYYESGALYPANMYGYDAGDRQAFPYWLLQSHPRSENRNR